MRVLLSSSVAIRARLSSASSDVRTANVAALLCRLSCFRATRLLSGRSLLAFFVPSYRPYLGWGGAKGQRMLLLATDRTLTGALRRVLSPAASSDGRGCRDDLLSVPALARAGHHSLLTPTGVPQKPCESPPV